MATKFFLRTTQSKGTANLYTRINRKNLGITNWYLCTHINVDIEAWNKAQKSLKSQSAYYATPEGAKVQEQINKVEGVIKDAFLSGLVSSSEDKIKLEQEIGNIINEEGIKAKEETSKRQKEREEKRLCIIVNYYEYFFKGIKEKTIRQKRGNKTYQDGSVTVWRVFGDYLNNYLKLNGWESRTFEEIDKAFADGFVIYLENLGLMPSTINKQITCFRRLCYSAAEDSKNKNLTSVRVWHERELKDKEKRAEIALSDKEINELYKMKLDGIRAKVRDIWVLGYFTAQRVSDYTKLTKDNFSETKNGVSVITLTQQKTGNDVVIPILDNRVFDICKKYRYRFPKLNKRDINRYIKDVLCELSETVPSLKELYRTQLSMKEREKEEGFIRMEKRIISGEKLHGEELKYYKQMKAYSVTHQSGNKLWKRDSAGYVIKYKWELVSSHTSRRSAVTSLYETNLLNAKDIMSISGHTTLKNFEGYIKRGAIEQAESIAEKMAQIKKVSLMKKEG